MKFWRIVWWGCKLFDDLSPYACSWLFHPHHRTVTRITLNKKHHLVIPHEHIIITNVIHPPLHGSFSPHFVFICSCAGRCQRWRQRRNESFGVGGYQMICQFREFRVRALDVSDLGSTEFGKIGLFLTLASSKQQSRFHFSHVCRI